MTAAADRTVLQTEITIRIREASMMNYDLMEVLRWNRKMPLKPPDWNHPQQMELFSDSLY